MKIIRIAREYGEGLFKISIDYISIEEYLSRMGEIGWEAIEKGSHWELHSPINPNTGRKKITSFSANNWEKNWKKQRQDFRKKIKSHDMDFVFYTPFVIPPNFNIYTLQIEEKNPEDDVFRVYFNQLPSIPIETVQVLYNGQWKAIEDYDFQGPYIMFSDESVATFKPNEQIIMRKI